MSAAGARGGTRARLARLVLCLAAAACGREESAADGTPARTQTSVLLVTLDTTRTDALSCYGVHAGVTPHLDGLAAEGVRYLRASTVAPHTLTAHASILTGLYPIRHTARVNGMVPLPQSAESIAERARDAGYQTAAFVGAVVLDGVFGLDQGFERYDGPTFEPRRTTSHFAERPAKEVVDQALAWYSARDRARSFFLWVHLFDAHSPYVPSPDVLAGKFERNPYLGELATIDRELERLFAELRREGELERTFVAVVADHGEAFGEHEEWSHGTHVFDETMGVPLILRYPDRFGAGTSSDDLVSVVDLAPTLVEAMGLAPLADVDGVSLFRRDVPADRGVYFESYVGYISFGTSPVAGWRDARYKYVHSSAPELYDAVGDRAEKRNLFVERARETEPYRAAIQRVVALPRLAAGALAEDAALQRMIGSLGYFTMEGGTAGFPDPLAPSDRRSPTQLSGNITGTYLGISFSNQGKFPEAEKTLREVVERNPANLQAIDVLASALLRQQKYDEAIPLLSKLVTEGPKRAGNFLQLGIVLKRVGRPREAIALLLRGLELDPDDANGHRTLGNIYKDAGETQKAIAAFERVLEIDPNDAMSRAALQVLKSSEAGTER